MGAWTARHRQLQESRAMAGNIIPCSKDSDDYRFDSNKRNQQTYHINYEKKMSFYMESVAHYTIVDKSTAGHDLPRGRCQL